LPYFSSCHSSRESAKPARNDQVVVPSKTAAPGRSSSFSSATIASSTATSSDSVVSSTLGAKASDRAQPVARVNRRPAP
jgi:hypothetical protein